MKNLLTLCITVIFIFTVLNFLPVHGESQIYDSVLRLHVLANSDTKEDQQLKLKVRDALITKTGELFKSCKSKEDAEETVRCNIDYLESVAQNTVYENGFDYPVKITLSKEDYPTRKYESLCFPMGKYSSLRVLIGNAEGQNWWCVLFPPLCLSAASGNEDSDGAFISAGLCDEQYKIITQSDGTKYKVRFKILESFQSAKKSVNDFLNEKN